VPPDAKKGTEKYLTLNWFLKIKEWEINERKREKNPRPKRPEIEIDPLQLPGYLWREYTNSSKEFTKRSKILSKRKRNGEISYREWNEEILKMRKERVALQDALIANPIICMQCKSVKSDLQQDKRGGWECYNQEHELMKRDSLILHPHLMRTLSSENFFNLTQTQLENAILSSYPRDSDITTFGDSLLPPFSFILTYSHKKSDEKKNDLTQKIEGW
jgi:hypothetical protein